MISLINILVSISNLVAIPFIWKKNDNNKYLIFFPMFASFLYHLAETKHHLPGIYPFNLYINKLLWLDRICAILSGFFVLRSLLLKSSLISNKFLLMSSFGHYVLSFLKKIYYIIKLILI